ncbi:MAG TPA: Eco57I restriction-modification methylase domain-containing protein, partial [Chloroflexia bacterium]|nr:Eco57I restriction-modification methylase domain-containing protein [Chloroflexia bacterium]
LADFVIATTFGVSMDPGLWTLFSYVAAGRAVATTPKFDAWQADVERVAAERRFFHWELAFPEVFFDAHGEPKGDAAGFDAVIGNPPYVRQEALAAFKPYFATAYPEVYQGTADLFVYFIAQGLHLLRRGGHLAYISSNSWLRANYATPLRAYLREKVAVESLVDLGDNRVFADAPDVYPAILVLRRDTPAADQTAQAAVFTRGEGLQDFAGRVPAKLAPVAIYNQDDSGWQMGDDEERRVFQKLLAAGRPLGEVVGEQMYRGVVTGLNEAFIVDQATHDRLVVADPANAAILKPLLRGEDLRPWYQENEGRWLIFTRRGIEIDSYPAVKAYLEQFRSQLEPRPTDWDNAQLWPGRKPGPYQWYEIQDSVDYYEAFEQPKIVWPDITKLPRFSWNETGSFVNDKGFIAIIPDPSILAILQSRALWFCVSQLCVPLGERAGSMRYQQKSQFISLLPIPDPPPAEREALGTLALAITAEARARYALHRKTQHRILADLGTPGRGLNDKLTAWWTLDFAGWQAELHKVFKRTIPPKARDGWEEWFAEQCAAHQAATRAIVAHETALNARVYALFALTPAEVALIERRTKYPYGEV